MRLLNRIGSFSINILMVVNSSAFFRCMLVISLLTSNAVSGQTDKDYLMWNPVQKLTANDFEIKTANATSPCFGQYTLEYRVNGYDFLTKNFNRKVYNYFIKTASWLDTSMDASNLLLYQQTLFDMSEVYARHFRQQLRKNRKKIIKGIQIAEDLNKEIVTVFAKRRVEFERDTKSGSNMDKVREWYTQMQTELNEMAEFAYDK